MPIEPYKAQAMVHSLKEKREVLIISFEDNNNVRAVYDNKLCTAVFNPFSGCFYVDDVYGILTEIKP